MYSTKRVNYISVCVTFMFPEVPVVNNPGRNVVLVIFMALIAVITGIIFTYTGFTID